MDTTITTTCPLTIRELEVINLLIQSLTAKQIAEKLSLSKRTVEKHLENIREALEVHDDIGIVVTCLAEGYITLPKRGE